MGCLLQMFWVALLLGLPSTTDAVTNLKTLALKSTAGVETHGSFIVVFKQSLSPGASEAHYDWVKKTHLHDRGFAKDLKIPASIKPRNDVRQVQSDQVMFQNEVPTGIRHTYNFLAGDFAGYSGYFSQAVIQQIQEHPEIDYVEADSATYTRSSSLLQTDAPWGLARVSHRDNLTAHTADQYLYAHRGGDGVDAYVIDTGINTGHADFEGRAHWSRTIPRDTLDIDANGHGTHCSGIIGGLKYGIAKHSNLYAVRVFDSYGGGRNSDVLKGIEWVVNAHANKEAAAKAGRTRNFKGSVVNMSLGGEKSLAMDAAVTAAVDAGLHVTIAAGNDNDDACKFSPFSTKAIMVGASTITDHRANFSNYGKCVDVFAPGHEILSTWIGNNTAINTISGTSMAAPHVCGLLAYLLSLQPSRNSAYAVEMTPAKLKSDLLLIATKNALDTLPDYTNNLLAWNGGGDNNYTKIVRDGYRKALSNGPSLKVI